MSTKPMISIPGCKLTTVKQLTNTGAAINFGTSFPHFSASSKPLAPLVMACFDDEGNINVSAFLYIPNSNNGQNITFQINILETNSNKLAFYISHEATPTNSQIQYPYGISFSTSGTNYKEIGITDIKVYGWDDDPEGSRGTETVVLDPMG